MIGMNDFLNIFKKTAFREKELRKFYSSIKKSVILLHLGKRAWPELFKLEETCQWPVLKEIADPDLSIYRGADKALLDRFIKTIIEEKGIRDHKGATDKVRYWSALQYQIEERINLFTQIFAFTGDDVGHCETVAERYSQVRKRRMQKRRKMWQIGFGAGAATVAGAAAIWYISKKDKKITPHESTD
ncbi:MAG TPA: hypothetical protein VFG09_10120 [Thermodesulfovibrionales bacterium]|jgi:hypothetical protein|nr:hypothetical protein [Thermodesulfovibrionales bacterium]